MADDFPQLCETCLGPNPYVRMERLRFGDKLCKLSNLPFQAFKWKAGSGGRVKETVVSMTVARERDICQACLNDMKYGLPVGVRDKLLAQEAAKGRALTLPTSEVGARYHYQQLAAAGGESAVVPFGLEMADQPVARQLDVFAKARSEIEARSKTAFRNLPKLCSFWLAGTCTRVLKKVCPFRPCCGQFGFPEIASNRPVHEELVKKLEAQGPAEVMQSLDGETRALIKAAISGVNRDDAIRKRVLGQDDLSKKYLGQFKHNNPDLVPPADTSITTLWVGGLDDVLGEAEVRDALYPFNPPSLAPQQIQVHVLRQAHCAFVEYPSRADAEAVAAAVQRSLVVGGKACVFDWAKPKPAGDGGAAGAKGGAKGGPKGGSKQKGSAASSSAAVMLPPPGMDAAPPSAYSLPGLPAPRLEPPRKVARTGAGAEEQQKA